MDHLFEQKKSAKKNFSTVSNFPQQLYKKPYTKFLATLSVYLAENLVAMRREFLMFYLSKLYSSSAIKCRIIDYLKTRSGFVCYMEMILGSLNF